MKKVFLIDDEKIIREGVRNIIDWEKNGFAFCGDASDGEMALPLIEKLKPDIVITDIQMPFMNGLELSRILREKMPWIKIIILSGYDDFEYARQAIRLQVTEYCLKPVTSRDLLEILEKVSDQIEQEKGQFNAHEPFANNRMEDTPDSFNEGTNEKGLFIGDGHKYRLENSEIDLNGTEDIHQFDRKELIEFIKNGSEEKIPEFCESYSFYLKDDNNRSPFYIYYFLMDFTITITHYMKERENEAFDTLQEINQLELKISFIQDYQEILKYMAEMLQIVFRFLDQANNQYSYLIQDVKEYVHQNYQDPALSLSTIAQAVNMSPAYLSHLFSKENGQTIIEYITAYRIEKAKELLTTTIQKTYEIAYSVGYNDSQYFCHTFKKMTGMTTREFKKNNNHKKQAAM